VSTTLGATGITLEGKYVLLVSPGTHTLQVRSPGYIQTSYPSATVSAGQSVTKDIALLSLGADNETECDNCTATCILGRTEYEKSLDQLRDFRDRVLNKTESGKRLVKLYYTLGGSVRVVLQRNPDLEKRCLELIKKSLPFIKEALSGKRPEVPSSLANEADRFLFELQTASQPGLAKEIRRIRRDIKNFTLLFPGCTQNF